MGQKHITVGGNGVVLEPYDEDNGNVPEGALAITDEAFALLSSGGGFQLFMHDGNGLVENTEAVLAKEKAELVEAIIQDEMRALAVASKAGEITQINNAANQAALDTVRNALGK